MNVNKLFRVAILATLLVSGASAFSQNYNDRRIWDCGSVSSSTEGRWTYEDFGLGFRFQLPSGWEGGFTSVHGPSGPYSFSVETLFAPSDPKLHLHPGQRRGPTEVINGLNWTTLSWQTGTTGAYTYKDGVLVEFFGISPVRRGSTDVVPPESLAALREAQTSFTFFDDPYRTDRQLAALKVGQKLGGLTIKRIIPGAGGVEHPIGTVEFAGQLTLTGHVILPSPTMLGGWGPYTLSGFDVQSRSLVPRLKCPVEGRELGLPPIAIEFTNQEFTNRQFANVPSISEHHDWYEVVATVVVDHVTETFGGVWMAPEVSARLVKVISKSERQ